MEELPTGQIIAVCQLVDCLIVVENHQTWARLEDGTEVTGNDYFVGDFPVDGYAWVVENMEELSTYIPAKGQLGLWEHDLDIFTNKG